MQQNATECNVSCPEITDKQMRAVHWMARGYSLASTADKLNMRRETLWRWQQSPEFRVELEQEKKRRAEEIRGLMSRLTISAVESIRSLVEHGMDAKTQLQAAQYVLDKLGAEQIEQTLESQAQKTLQTTL